ncbi:MAG: D-alanyl-D-alanine carboxypeptidase [Syntrophus sp. (in: bacteria)]|nr:D-alanyl-D-alanine carboxypeptidase [Syntrophus sp. (in: bacteria)]
MPGYGMIPQLKMKKESMIDRRLVIFILSFCILAILLPEEVMSARSRRYKPPGEKYRSAMVMDVDTGQILYMENADRPVPPASVAKVLSLYLVYEALGEGRVHLQDKISVSKKAWRTKGSRMFLEPGSEVTLGELIKGVCVVSANDASVALAEHIAGDTDKFVGRMNATARQLGMIHSRFRNPHGLPAKGQMTTARDIAILSRHYLRRFPQSLQLHSTHSYTYHNITQHNSNLLLKRYPGTDGIKTGFVNASGYNIAATALQGNTRLIAVVLGSRTPGIRLRETVRLLDEGFRKIQRENAKG